MLNRLIFFNQSFLSDNFKVRSSAHGNIYAYEIPPAPFLASRLDISVDNKQKIPNGSLNRMNGSRETNTNPSNHSPAAPRISSHIGSSVHETSKQSVTNYSAMHIAATPPENVSEPDPLNKFTDTPASDVVPVITSRNQTSVTSSVT